MLFATEAQKAVYERVLFWVTETFGGSIQQDKERPVIRIQEGSTVGQVGVFPWGEDETIITTRACIVSGAEVTPDLMRCLLQENTGMRFGALGIDDEGTIILQHSIVGSTCDRNELEASVVAVLRAADEYDDRIIARWGGARALE